MSDQVEDLILGWTMIDLSDPPLKAASKIAQTLGISVDQFIDEAIAEKVARWDAEQAEAHLR